MWAGTPTTNQYNPDRKEFVVVPRQNRRVLVSIRIPKRRRNSWWPIPNVAVLAHVSMSRHPNQSWVVVPW